MKKLDQKKGLSATVSMLMTLVVCQSVSVQASDIDIYSNATGGQTRIMFVLDTSASMSASFAKFACDVPLDDSAVTVPNNSETSTTTPSYPRYYCTANITEQTSPKTYRYIRQVLSQTTAAVPAVPSEITYKRCGTSTTATVTSTGSCNNSGTLTATNIPSSGYCPLSPPTRSGNITTTYYYDRNGCGGTTGTARYRYRMEVKDSVPGMPASTVPTNNCTPTGSVTCNYEFRTCPTGATTTTGCTTVSASAPSGTYSNESCGTGCTAYFTPAVTTTIPNKRFYDRITRLKDGMFTVLQGLNGVTRLGDDIRVGLTRFTGGTSGTTDKTGVQLVRVQRLDATALDCTGSITQRQCILNKIAAMDAPDYTPTGKAYAIGARSLLTAMNGDTSSCNGNGVYVLTDGGPSTTSIADPETQMAATLTGFTCPASWNSDISGANSTFEFKSKSANPDNEKVWRCIAKFSNELLKGATGTRGKIKTAVVGFGKFYSGLDTYTGAQKNQVGPLAATNIDIANILNRYSSISNDYGATTGGASRADIANTALWGTYGRGGWYSASEPAEVAQSILNFVSEVKPEFDPVTTGSPTLPQDALNPLRIQPYGYYSSFVPKPQENTQLWVGNMNKYHIYNGALYNSAKTIPLIKSDGSLDTTANGLWTNGMKAQLPLGLGTNAVGDQVANRTIYTNRQVADTSPYAAIETDSLKKVNVTTLFGTGSTALFVNDPDKNYWLNLLGYNIGATEAGITLANLTAKPELRQVGSIMHSTPLLLTQSGQIIYSSNTIDTTNRDDYLLFGSTQGLLHVVDADTGVEKFAFAPNEMMQNQKNAFLSETSSTLGKNNLFYGVDAPWTAYTQYVSNANGTLTVKSSDRTNDGSTNTDLALKGLQWVYGGLRMGGRSYYALDLSDLDKPSLKFHINPDAAVTAGAPDTSNALSYMGQSWSKPTLAYVNFGGTKKLVMFVGGGYDAGYENAAYDQSTTTVGSGVYMFDANTGALLWWTSTNATAAKGAEAFTDTSSSTINMKYSVVSQINAIDRDNDGLVDNLYFGDLGGQAFRVDLNNAATGADASAKKANFAKRVVRLFSQNVSGGVSPRFYEMPSFSIHESDNGYVAAVAFSSGNRSSPLVGAAVANGNQAGSVVSASDGVFVVYDKDVAKSNLYATSPLPTLVTQNVSLAALNTTTGIAITGNNGWKYTYSTSAGAYKGMNELYALDGMLYVNVYHRDGTGIGGSCGAGVKGDSYVYQFCLPTGKCSFDTTSSGVPNSVKVGAGILGAGLGQGRTSANNTGLIVTRPDSLNCTTTPNLPECQEFTTTAKLRQLRWYETR